MGTLESDGGAAESMMNVDASRIGEHICELHHVAEGGVRLCARIEFSLICFAQRKLSSFEIRFKVNFSIYRILFKLRECRVLGNRIIYMCTARSGSLIIILFII